MDRVLPWKEKQIKYFGNKKLGVAYLSIPKNACTSIKYALSKKSEKKIEQKKLPMMHEEPEKYFDLIENIYKGSTEGFFTFTFVRDPFDRFISFYRNKVLLYFDPNLESYMKKIGIHYKMSIMDVLKIISKMNINDMNEHFLPQTFFVYKDGRCCGKGGARWRKRNAA